MNDHGGQLSRASEMFGGEIDQWVDLSTGINPIPYPIGEFAASDWTRLPDSDATSALEKAARKFWDVPESAAVLAAPGASALIARLPATIPASEVAIPEPTYNEHRSAFAAHNWAMDADNAKVKVVVHPNNPDGCLWTIADVDGPDYCVIDESFCDVSPEVSLIRQADKSGRIILKSFGKFWGLAGLRVGFAIGDPALVHRLRDLMGPWPVSGPALRIATCALNDQNWAMATRARLAKDAKRLDELMQSKGVNGAGGTDLFRLYETDDAAALFERLARHQILTRIFPYSKNWIRVGLLGPESDWARLAKAL